MILRVADNLPNTKKAGSGRDFVTEGTTNGSRGERHLIVVEFQKLLEVKELTLSSLWAKVAVNKC